MKMRMGMRTMMCKFEEDKEEEKLKLCNCHGSLNPILWDIVNYASSGNSKTLYNLKCNFSA